MLWDNDYETVEVIEGMRFSIIIPVYNVEKYVSKCIRSILEQTFRDFEIIVVNDGSTDNSIKKIRKITADTDVEVTILNQKNQRQGEARNNGVRHCKGEYIVFVDSDDYIDRKMLEILNSYLVDKSYDIIYFNSYVVDRNHIIGKYITGEWIKWGQEVHDKHELLLLPPEPWNKIYKREFYINSKVSFPKKILYEDAVFGRDIIVKADSVLMVDKCLYYYVQRRNSTMHSGLSDNMKDIITAIDILVSDFKGYGLFDEYFDELEYIAVSNILLIILNQILMYDYKNKMRDSFVDYIENKFPNCINNKLLNEQQKMKCELLLKRNYYEYYRKYCRKIKWIKTIGRFIPVKMKLLYIKLQAKK